MRVFLTSMSGLLLFEAMLALLLLAGLAVGLLTLQGRVLANAKTAQVHAWVMAEGMALLQGMRVNPQGEAQRPHWRHYQGHGSIASSCASASPLTATTMAQRQLCRLQQGLTQVLPETDFAYAVCARPAALPAATMAKTAVLTLSCPIGGSTRAEAWSLTLVWRVQQQLYVRTLRLSHV